MPQFDVFHNPGRQRDTIPFLVVLQNDRFARAITRFVAPLVRRGFLSVDAHYLAPDFVIDGQEVVLDVFNLATILAGGLGSPIASLADDASRTRLIRALDELISMA